MNNTSETVKFALSIFGLIICFHSLKAQKIIYQPIIINQCTGEIEIAFWSIADTNENHYWLEDLMKNEIELPELGVYYLHMGLGVKIDREPPFVIEIDSKGINHDTFYTKKFEIVTYVSNPPVSEYLDCDSLANGKTIDYYYNGNVRQSGIFQNGYPIDTVKQYYYTGELKSLYIPNLKLGKWRGRNFEFFRDGKLKKDHFPKKRYTIEYYSNGQILSKTTWNRKYRSKTKEYYKNRNLKRIRKRREVIRFSENGYVTDKITRQGIRTPTIIIKLIRIFNKNYFRDYRASFTWINMKDEVSKSYRIDFDNDDYWGALPRSINHIKPEDFNEIVLYQANQPYKKFSFQYIYENDEFTKQMVIFEIDDGEWVKKGTKDIDEVYSIVPIFMNQENNDK